MEGAVFLDARESWPGLYKLVVSVDVTKPSAAEQAAAWQSSLGLAASESPGQLAAQFNLSFPVDSTTGARCALRADGPESTA